MSRVNIFISHISTETELAQVLKDHLERDFLSLLDIFVSSDAETIQAGSRWLDAVDMALKNADLQIVLCSRESVGRPWVNFEAGAVWLRGIPVIPLCHSGMKPRDLPIPLSMLQGIECSDPAGLSKLYSDVAKILGGDPPTVDFSALAAQIGDVEKQYIQAGDGFETVKNPKILCAASKEFAEPRFGFNLDIVALEKAFPNRVQIERELSSRRLRELLTHQNFDIIHLSLAVDPENGDLIFNPVLFDDYKPKTSSPDIMSATGFAALLREANTKLVVLATCKALILAVEVAHVANMAASDTELFAKDAAEWSECFYDLIAQSVPLYKAFDLTKSLSNTPIRAVRHKDVAFNLMNT